MKRSSPYRTLYLLVVILIVPFMIMSFYTYSYIKESTEGEFNRVMYRITENTAIAIAGQPTEEIKKILHSISSQLDEENIAAYIDPHHTELNTIIPTIVNSTVYFSSVIISDSRGSQRAYPMGITGDISPQESEWFPVNGIKDDIYFSLPYSLPNDEVKSAVDIYHKAIMVSVNLFGDHSDFIGNIAFSLNMEEMSSTLKGIRIPHNGRFYVAAKDGTVIMYENSDEIFTKTLPIEWVKKSTDDRGHFYDSTKQVFVFYKRYDNPNWVAFTVVDKADFDAMAKPVYKVFWFIFCICLMLYVTTTVLIKLYFGQTVTRLYMNMNGLNFEADKKGIDTIYRELKAKNSHLTAAQKDAETDGLMQIYNRKKFDSDLELRIRNEQPFHLAFIDIDNFKSINDTYGHDLGDEVLKFISKTGKRVLGDGNTLYRFGGEELVVIFTGMSLEESCEVLNGWRQLVYQREWRELGLHVSFSGGLTTWVAGDSAADVIKRSDAHLYAAKKSGKNRIVFASNDA